MLSRLLAFLVALFRRKPKPPEPPPVPTLTRPIVGVVAHRLDDSDVAALRMMGVRHVRLSIYANGDGSQWIDRAVSEGFDVLAVTYRDVADRGADATRWPTVTWQIGNEPDWRVLSPVQAAALTAGGDVTCGIGGGTPQAWLDVFLAAVGSMQVAFHAYARGADFTRILGQFNATHLPWITETGDADADALRATLHMIDGTKYPRVYLYVLQANVPTDPFTLTAAHQQAITQFIQGV